MTGSDSLGLARSLHPSGGVRFRLNVSRPPVPWSHVLDQTRAKDALSRALASGRIPHAVLFHGPSGTGKLAAALAFAQALQCERRGTPGGPPADACGTCIACTKVARALHPDVHVFLPYPRQKSATAKSDPRPSDYPERVRLIAADPYGAYDYRSRAKLDDDGPSNKQVEHRKLPVNEHVREEMKRHPVEGRYVVGILPMADAVRKEAANAILKLLEEPPPRVVLMLLAERVENVLPTIVSRCQRVRFDRLAPESIEGALVRAQNVDAGRAAVAARMADGSYTQARRLVASEELEALRSLAVDFVRQSFTGRASKLQPIIEQVSKMGRESVKAWLGLVGVWIRDLVLARAAGDAAPLVNVDVKEVTQKFVAHVPHADLEGMAAQVEDAAALVAGNTPAALVLTALAFGLRDAMHGRGRRELVVGLDRAA